MKSMALNGKTFFKWSLVAVAGLFWTESQAVAAGADLYDENCSACHLENGAGDAEMMVPSIAGMNVDYVTRQLTNLQNDIRTFDEDNEDHGLALGMVGIVKELSDEDVTTISAYVAEMPIVPLEQETELAGFRERGLYNGCSSCHGVEGEGYPKLNAPRLANQYGWYLSAQLAAFRDGSRGAHADDEYGKQMKVMAEQIESWEDINLLVNYIMGFGK